MVCNGDKKWSGYCTDHFTWEKYFYLLKSGFRSSAKQIIEVPLENGVILFGEKARDLF